MEERLDDDGSSTEVPMDAEGDGNVEEEDPVDGDSPQAARRTTRAAAADLKQRAGTLPAHTPSINHQTIPVLCNRF